MMACVIILSYVFGHSLLVAYLSFFRQKETFAVGFVVFIEDPSVLEFCKSH